MQQQPENRRKSDEKVDKIYDALIGTPRSVGFLEWTRAELRALEKWQKTSEQWHRDHMQLHEMVDAESLETGRIRTAFWLRIAERILMAVLAILLAWLGAAQLIGGGGGP